MTERPHTLELIEGKSLENERLFRQLQTAPEQFDEAVFDSLLDRFRPRMSLDERLCLIAGRLEATPCASEIEKRAVIAAALGDTPELERLAALLDRRNASGFRVVSADGDPAAPARSL